MTDHASSAALAATCHGCDAARWRSSPGRPLVCTYCGAQVERERRVSAPAPTPQREAPPACVRVVGEHRAPVWVPDPLADLACVARFAPQLFGRAMEPRERAGSGGSGAREGRGDFVDGSHKHSWAQRACDVMRALIRSKHGVDASILWMSYGVIGHGSVLGAAEQAVATGFCPCTVRESWPSASHRATPAQQRAVAARRDRQAIAWGRDALGVWWVHSELVPEGIARGIALGFAPKSETRATSSSRIKLADSVAGWGEQRLKEARAAYCAEAEAMLSRGRGVGQ